MSDKIEKNLPDQEELINPDLNDRDFDWAEAAGVKKKTREELEAEKQKATLEAEAARKAAAEAKARAEAEARAKAEAEAKRRAEEIANLPSMAEFESELMHSMKTFNPGDIVEGTVIGVSDSKVTVDLGSYAEGIIHPEELSNDPRFSIKGDIHVGDRIKATVIRESRAGDILLSLKQADDVLSWEKLKALMESRQVSKVKVQEAVKAGVTTFLCGVRAFIPASQLSLEYVDDTSEYVGRELEVIVTDVNADDKKLVLSAKEVLRERAAADRNSRISRLQTGLVTTGTVEKLESFGAFVNIGEDLSGLVHISQICERRIKKPSEVLKVGDTVTVKIMDVKEGKISLSIKAATEKDEIYEDAVDDAAEEYTDGEEATTSLAGLLARLNIK